MSFYFREKPRFGDKLRGKSGEELIQELKQQFDDSNTSFFEPTSKRIPRDAFERHAGFSRGFPVNDVEGFGRRSSDIRSHLDDLASRHPEFADHLSDAAWGDVLGFHKTGSLKNRRRRGSGSSSTYQGHPDEDARSQASGSSGTSAASGASGVSSHGEPSNVFYYDKQQEPASRRNNESSNTNNSQSTRRNPIPQYGLRHTVDIGQQRHEMENDERSKENRGQRSMSAPPENRQQNDAGFSEQSAEQPQNANQRFVSRVDITPQFGQSASSTVNNDKTGSKSQHAPSNQQPQKTPQQQSNVRHIPIFVEGRDEPVVPKNLDSDQTDSTGWPYSRPQRTESPPHYQQNSPFGTPPQFHRPSHFNQHYTGGRARDWLPNFEEEIYSPHGASVHHPGMRRHHQPPFTSQSPPRQAHYRQTQPETKPSQRPYNEPQHFNQQPHSASPQQPPQPQQQPQEAAAPAQPRKQTQPKDPLEKVADVQQEVDSLHQQVIQWNGKSRKDKDYMYLDEMLTRELIKLDDIETEGKENVRQARKNAIKSIQDSISLLESKAPLNDQKPSEATMDVQQETPETLDSAEKIESMAVNDENNTESNNKRTEDNEEQQPISLPLVPSSPTKESVATLPEVNVSTQDGAAAAPPENANTVVEQPSTASQQDNVEMDVAMPVDKVSSTGSMVIQTNAETEQSPAPQTTPAVVPETGMEVVENPKSPKAMKKSRKTKKPQQQVPISEGAIPLPAPEPHETNVAK